MSVTTKRCASVVRGAPVLMLLALGGCAQLQPRPELPVESALPIANESELDRAAGALEASHPGQSAFHLLVEGPEAFAVRAQSALTASRSLDVQTYIWHDDLTGLFLVHTLLEAADRGVKVRLLVDDMDARSKNVGLAALASHPNISVRLFNPFASRSGTASLVGEGLTSFDRINRRMHNKTWIADNRIAIAGGRNIGNEYFGASDEVNFVDLDFAMIGPIVRDASVSFDKYWNSPSAYPMEVLDPQGVNAAALAQLRPKLKANADEARTSNYATVLREDNSVKRLVSGNWPLEWASDYEFVSDDPHKVTMTQQDAGRTMVGASLFPRMQSATSALTVISPYFVPGDKGSAALTKTAQAGTKVRILTNSLAANDVGAVHGGYSRHRKALLRGGVQLWELKPLATSGKSSLFGSTGASLHTKALAVDSKALFVGSYNLDPRSTWLNCEQGVLVENSVLATQLEAIFATDTEGQRAWHVTLNDDQLHWSDGTEQFDSDPKASAGKRFQAWIARVLHIDAQL